jgi:signal transduction histidine kinase
LRNPLGPIRNAVALMAKGPDVQTTPRMRAVIERQVVHLARLVDDLVDMSRVGTEKLRIQRERVDIVDIIDAAIDVSRPAMDKRLQALIVQVPSCALHLQGDFVRLTQVLNNLLDNASKYTPEGGEIRLSVDKGDDVILIKVADSGIGISADVLPQVFEPFVQDPHAIAFNGGGLGIGLTVVRELVEAHGGTVAARSGGPGQGSCFVVELSLDKDRGSPASAT